MTHSPLPITRTTSISPLMSDTSNPPVTRKGSKAEQTLSLPDRQIRYMATAEWQTLFEQEKPVAEMFHVAYVAEAEGPAKRPLTFVFNGDLGLRLPTFTWGH